MRWRPGRGSNLDPIETRLIQEKPDGTRIYKVWPAKLPEPHNAAQWCGETLRWVGYEPVEDPSTSSGQGEG